MLPHIGNKRPGMPNLGNSVMYQASQVKKKVRSKGLLRAFFGSSINACLCLLVIGVFASGGIFYGVMINNLDVGKAEHDEHGGFWGRKTSINETMNRMDSGIPADIGVGQPMQKPRLMRQRNFKAGSPGPPASAGSEGAALSSPAAGTGKAVPPSGVEKSGGSTGIPGATRNNATGPVRGADPAESKLYARDSGGTFNCDGGAVKISWDKVNDEFCDCADSSDEPGTSACDKGHFFCMHWASRWKSGDAPDAKHSVSSSKVNDGICDCCDGSDEWERTEVSCKNRCE